MNNEMLLEASNPRVKQKWLDAIHRDAADLRGFSSDRAVLIVCSGLSAGSDRRSWDCSITPIVACLRHSGRGPHAQGAAHWHNLQVALVSLRANHTPRFDQC